MPKNTDPSRTVLLRRRFAADIRRRLKKIAKEVRNLLVTEDAFGLKERSPLELLQRQFQFQTRPQKLATFKAWLQGQINLNLLSIENGNPWSDVYIQSAYKKGTERAYVQANKANLAQPAGVFQATKEQFVRSSFFQAETLEKVQLLGTRAFEQLNGIGNVTAQQLNRIFAEGLVNGWGPEKIARNIDNTIARIDRTRARVLARTEIIHAHAEGQLDSFKRLGIDEVQAEVEWLTAGDERVCPDCAAMEGKKFKVDEAHGLIPLHPNSYSRDTEIYIDNGFVPVSELKRGYQCLSLNPKTFDLEYVKVVETVEHEQKEMIHFSSRNFDLLVTPNHSMFAKRRERHWTGSREWEFIQAKKVIEETAIYRSSEWKGTECSCLDIDGHAYSTSTFAEFMGWWLSEGSRNRDRIAISQSREKNSDKYARLTELADELSTDGKVWCGAEQVLFRNKALLLYLSRFGHAHEKFVPHEIKDLSSQYIRIFLDAYSLGDGHRRKARDYKGGNFRDEIVYTTSSKRMADGLGELLIKVGRCPSYNLLKHKGKIVEHANGPYRGNFDIWMIRECYSQTSRINKRTGIRVGVHDYNDIVYCVELEKNHTLLVRRNGKVTWSGNCRCAWIPVVGKNG